MIMRLEPLTAREALLLIRWKIAQADLNSAGQHAIVLDQIAEQGLSRTEPVNFELSDQLADRLAEAHNVLRAIRDLIEGDPSCERTLGEINGVLALPPDLEAMVERRIGHG